MQTIREYLDSLPDITMRDGQSTRDTMANAMPVWSNTICRGYLVDAMDRANIDEETQARILGALWQSFDLVTYTEAEEKGK